MKIVVIGGSGFIGSKLVPRLREKGHEAIAASPNSGVNTLTGEGLAEVLKGASVVVDVSNSPSWDDSAVLNFFETSTRNLLKYGAEASVKHFVALSVVGTEGLAESGYFRAKIAQEKLVHLPPMPFQPMAGEDVASALARVAMEAPLNGTIEIGGPEPFRLDELIRRRLAQLNDPREVITDPNARYSGAKVDERTLVPGKAARLGETRFETWVTQPAAKTTAAAH